MSETEDYIWEIGQTTMVLPEGMEEKVKGTILKVLEGRGEGYTKFLYVKYTDPRDKCPYLGWFNDQTGKAAHAREMNGKSFLSSF